MNRSFIVDFLRAIAPMVANGSQFAMTVYAVYTTYISAPIIVAFGVIAFLASVVQVCIDLRYPPARGNRRELHPDAIELRNINVIT